LPPKSVKGLIVMSKTFWKLTLAVTACLLAGFNPAQADMGQKISGIVKKQSQKKVIMGVEIVRADTGAAVYSHNAHSPLTPASNMKIITSSSAVRLLGADYQFTTKVGMAGDTLVLIGSGDPLLGDSQTDAKYGRKPGWLIDDIVAKLKAAGVTKIKNIVTDTSIFEANSIHPNWPADQLNNWYASQITGLNYNDNCINIIAKPSGGGIEIYSEPLTSYITIVNKTAAGGKHGTWCSRQIGTNTITVWGTIPKMPITMELTIDRPAGLLAFLIAEKLPQTGISVEGQLFEMSVPVNKVKMLADYKTPLSDVLERCNKNSLQLAAECLFKTISAQTEPEKKNGSWQHGREVIGSHLEKLGIPRSEFLIDDGCGLSDRNKLSPNAIITVLLNMYKSSQWQMFSDSLAVGGEDGTIEKYFKANKYKGKVLGKTGYISGVKSFSGICCTEHGEYLFSILTNRAAGDSRDAINDIVKAIIDSK
jgi:D-alanyl-D-alanine carboxypeptidase/D-alanyl-D-alanine-endopeptidase (penicillin-binding protein 4)